MKQTSGGYGCGVAIILALVGMIAGLIIGSIFGSRGTRSIADAGGYGVFDRTAIPAEAIHKLTARWEVPDLTEAHRIDWKERAPGAAQLITF